MSKCTVISVATFIAANCVLSATSANQQPEGSGVSSALVCGSGYVDIDDECVVDIAESMAAENDPYRAKEVRKPLESFSDSQKSLSIDGPELTDDEKFSALISDLKEPVSRKRDCGGKVGPFLCAHDRLTERGFRWVMPALFVLMLGTVVLYAATWIWMVMRNMYQMIRRKRDANGFNE